MIDDEKGGGGVLTLVIGSQVWHGGVPHGPGRARASQHGRAGSRGECAGLGCYGILLGIVHDLLVLLARLVVVLVLVQVLG